MAVQPWSTQLHARDVAPTSAVEVHVPDLPGHSVDKSRVGYGSPDSSTGMHSGAVAIFKYHHPRVQGEHRSLEFRTPDCSGLPPDVRPTAG